MSVVKPVRIGNRMVGPGHKPFIIAEACINHHGDPAIAEKMVHSAHAMGADCIKFQLHVPENEMLRSVPISDNFAKPLWDVLVETELSFETHRHLKKLCGQLGIMYACTPFSRVAADRLEEIGVDFYKTGSGELTNLPLMEHIARKGKPMIVSTGMCRVEEIQETVDLITALGTPLILTHCVSAYPTPYDRVNLDLIPAYMERFGVPIGLSDHSRGIYTALGAVALGACVLEKHFTFDRMQKGPDHPVSIEPYELGELSKGAEAIFLAKGQKREIFPEEEQIVVWARESVVTEKPIKAGATITKDMVWVKRPSPGKGVVAARDLDKVVGKRALVDIPKDQQMKWEYLST
jgi:N-acetylneuraminate synthase